MKKILVALLIACMMLSVSAVALAAETITTWDALKNALESGKDVVLDADIQETTGAFIRISGTTASLDLNGHTIEGIDKNVTMNSTGNFGLITLQNGANLTVSDTAGGGAITLSATTDRGWNALSAVIQNECGTVTIESGRLEHKGGTSMAYAIDNNSNGKPATLTVNGGELVSSYIGVRLFANSATALNEVTINGGTVEGDRCGIWLQSPTSNRASAAKITINDGEIIGTTNSALNISAGDKGESITIDITGGSFESDGMAIKASGDSANSSIEVTGGSYSDTSAQEYVPEGKLIIEVEEDSTPYKIGEEAEEALAEEDNNVVILQAGSEDLIVGEGTTVTNETDSAVSINGTALAAGESVTVPKTVAATPTPAPAAPVVTAAPAAPAAPKTGDNTNIALWMALMAISAVALVGLRKKSKASK